MIPENLPTPSPRLRRWLILAVAVLILLVGVRYSLKASEDRSAFVRWRDQLHALGRGEDIYERHVYPNPPIMALMLYPLSLLPEVKAGGLDIDLGAMSWFAIKVLLATLAFFWTIQLVQSREQPFPFWAQAALVALSIRPIVGDLSHGNVNILILFLVVASLFAFRGGKDFLSGIILGLAIACKVTPALFIPYFLWKRAWKTLAGCAVGLGLFLFLVPGLFLGFQHNARLLHSWYERMVLPYARGEQITTEHSNQSLPGLIYRLTTESPSFLDAEDRPADFHNVLDFEPLVAKRIVQGCGLLFLVLMCFCCRTPLAERGDWRLAAEFSIVILGMLLFSERTWKHHCVTLLVPFGVLCYYIAACRPSPAWKCSLIAAVAASVVFMASTSTAVWESIDYRLGAKLAQVYGGYVWAYVALLVPLMALLVRHRQIRMPHTAGNELPT